MKRQFITKQFLSGLVVLALGLALSFFPALAQAAPVLDFGIVAPTTGTISYAGGASPLVGSGIEVDNITGIGTPSNNGVTVTCVSCTLNFTTGNLTSSTATTWNFGGGGSITITGGVDLIPGGAPEIPVGTTLLSGSFDGASVTKTNNTFRIAGASFVDTKDEDLLDFYGAPNTLWRGGFNISFLANGSPPNSFTSTTVLSGDVANTEPIPEPASLVLLGSGLFSLGAYARKKFSLKS